MQRRFFSMVLAGTLLAGLAAGPARAQDSRASKDYPSAYDALHLIGKTLGADAINRVVEVTGRDGKPQPLSWRVVLKEGEGSKEIDIVNGKIEAQRPLGQATTLTPFKLPELNLDSTGAFDATDAQARKTHVRFDSVNYTLRTSEKTGKLLWTLALVDQNGTPAGTMRISAVNGSIVSMDGRVASETTTAPKKTVAQEKTPAKPTATATPRPAATPRATPAAVVVERTPPRREPVRTAPPVTTTTTTTTVQTNRPVAVIDVPDADAGGGEAPPPSDGGNGGFFTRTGRTLDHTSRNVSRSLDRAGRDVDHTFRRAGATVQRFFTGRSDLDSDPRPAPPAQDDGQPD